MGQHRQNDLDPGGTSIGGATATSSVSFALPTLVNGDKPERVRVAVAGPTDIWVSVSNGAQAVTNATGMHVNANESVILRAWGQTHVNYISLATGSRISVTPLNE